MGHRTEAAVMHRVPGAVRMRSPFVGRSVRLAAMMLLVSLPARAEEPLEPSTLGALVGRSLAAGVVTGATMLGGVAGVLLLDEGLRSPTSSERVSIIVAAAPGILIAAPLSIPVGSWLAGGEFGTAFWPRVGAGLLLRAVTLGVGGLLANAAGGNEGDAAGVVLVTSLLAAAVGDALIVEHVQSRRVPVPGRSYIIGGGYLRTLSRKPGGLDFEAGVSWASAERSTSGVRAHLVTAGWLEQGRDRESEATRVSIERTWRHALADGGAVIPVFGLSGGVVLSTACSNDFCGGLGVVGEAEIGVVFAETDWYRGVAISLHGDLALTFPNLFPPSVGLRAAYAF